jgi:hypothetical protein
VTRYAVDVERGALVGAWATGAGDYGFTVAVLPSSCPVETALRVVAGLDRLSGVLWRAYTHPASAAGDEAEPDSEALWVPTISSMQVRQHARTRAGCRRVGRVFARSGRRCRRCR